MENLEDKLETKDQKNCDCVMSTEQLGYEKKDKVISIPV